MGSNNKIPSHWAVSSGETTSRWLRVTYHSPSAITRLAKIQPQALNGR